MQPYVAVQYFGGVVVLCDHTQETSYGLYDPDLPAPEVLPYLIEALLAGAKVSGPRDEYATRTLPLVCLGDDGEAAEDALNELSRAVRSDRSRLMWRSYPTSPTIWTTIRSGTVVEQTSHMLRRGQGGLAATLMLRTDAEWTGSAVSFTGDDIDVTKGDRPARLQLKVTSDGANPLIGLGIQHDPVANYDPVDTYTPTAKSLTGDYSSLAVAPTFDTGSNRGRSVIVAQVSASTPGAAATLTSDMTNALADITLTAVTAGADGNDISITYVDPAAFSQALAVVVTGQAIVVNLATGADPGAITSTGAEVVAALAASTAAAALVTAVDEGDGSGVVNALALAYLTGGTDDVTKVRLRAVAQTYGSGLAGVMTAAEHSTTTLQTAARWTLLPGPVAIPAGGVPGVETDSGYGPELVVAEASGGTATASATAWYQSITLTRGEMLTEVALKLNANGVAGEVQVRIDALFNAPYDVLWQDYHTGTFAASHDDYLTFSVPNIRVPHTGTYYLRVWRVSGDASAYHTASSAYAGGAALSTSGVDLGYDYVFRVKGMTALGFNSDVTIEGQNTATATARTATVHSVMRLPADLFCAVYEHGFLADEGVLVDALDPVSFPATYLTTSTAGTAGQVLSPATYHGTPRPLPGLNKVVTAGDGTFTVSGVWMPCYSNAAAGGL